MTRKAAEEGDEAEGGEEEREKETEDGNARGKERREVGGGGRAYIAYYETRFHRQVHLRAPTHVRGEKGTGIIHYDSSFRNNNEALRRHALLRRGILHLGHVAARARVRNETENLTDESAFLRAVAVTGRDV